MRIDSFITLNLIQPLHRTLEVRPATRGRSLPVLMYHSISEDPEAGVRPYYRICASPARFREQMQWLNNNGWRGATLGDGLAWLKSPGQAPRSHGQASRLSVPSVRSAVLTFDDGYRDFYHTASPILREFGFSATVFLPTAFIGDTSRSFKSRPCLIWNEVRELHRAGIEFGSHTVTHPWLVELDWPQVHSELRDSKREIENKLGAPCAAFAYPFSLPETNRPFVRQFRDALAEAGYASCATTRIGHVRPGDDPMQLKRLPVNSGDGPEFFQAKLAGAYDWFATVQSGFKRIKSALSMKSNPDRRWPAVK